MTEAPQWVLLRRWPRESPTRALLLTLLVSFVCSALIATAVDVLQPYQEHNRAEQRTARIRELIAAVPGLGDVIDAAGPLELEARVVDLATGEYEPLLDPRDLDARAAARDPETSVALAPERDLAGIGRRARRATVFEILEDGQLRLVVLPVYGAGYVSTLHGHLALDADLNTIRGLSFHEHGETPGLGSEIENPQWRAQWSGKRLRDESGQLRIEVARGRAAAEHAAYQVDGIAGATRTGAGVTRILHFWVGPDGFGPYLDRLRREGARP